MNLSGCEFTERELLERVMRNMRGKRRGRYMNQRWILVKAVFGVGSGVAYALCHEFGLDPDKELSP
jgi:hypothetical protein